MSCQTLDFGCIFGDRLEMRGTLSLYWSLGLGINRKLYTCRFCGRSLSLDIGWCLGSPGVDGVNFLYQESFSWVS